MIDYFNGGKTYVVQPYGTDGHEGGSGYDTSIELQRLTKASSRRAENRARLMLRVGLTRIRGGDGAGVRNDRTMLKQQWRALADR